MDSLSRGARAAYIDGCGFFGRYFRIILPLSQNESHRRYVQFLTCWTVRVCKPPELSQNCGTIQLGIPILHQPVFYRLRVDVRGDRHQHRIEHHRLMILQKQIVSGLSAARSRAEPQILRDVDSVVSQAYMIKVLN
jgi:hypothetical protein